MVEPEAQVVGQRIWFSLSSSAASSSRVISRGRILQISVDGSTGSSSRSTRHVNATGFPNSFSGDGEGLTSCILKAEEPELLSSPNNSTFIRTGASISLRFAS